MTQFKTLLIAAPIAAGLLAAPAAHAEWRSSYHYEYHRSGYGFPVVGALAALGAAAVVGGIVAAQQPPVVYAPPPPVTYAPPPGYYYAPPPAPGYYYAPGYGP